MKVLIKDNYFKDPDSIRELALSLDEYRVDNQLIIPPIGWKGQRTYPLRNLKNQTLDECAQGIYKICYDYFDFENYIVPYLNKQIEELTITTYFHITTEETRGAFPDFWQDRFHKDFETAVAGVVYLTPNAPLKAGTSILNGPENQFVNVENVYNRLVAYEGTRIHAVSDVFGNSKETGRMTFTFFIHDSKFPPDIKDD